MDNKIIFNWNDSKFADPTEYFYTTIVKVVHDVIAMGHTEVCKQRNNVTNIVSKQSNTEDNYSKS